MRLDEILDRPLPFAWTQRRFRYWSGEFESDGEDYTLVAFRDDHRFDPPLWGIAFGLSDSMTGSEILNTGVGFEVFATAIAGITEFVHIVKPAGFIIMADNDQPSRVKLYSMIARRLAPKVKAGGYKQTKCPSHQYGQMFNRNLTSWCFTKEPQADTDLN